MKMALYCLYDRLAEEGGPVWNSKNDACAIRGAMASLKEARIEDFRLYCLGEYDPEKVMIHADPMAREVPLLNNRSANNELEFELEREAK